VSPLAGALVTDLLDHDGGRQVTAYVPPDGAQAVVFAADGGWHVERLSEVLERAGVLDTMIVGADGLPDDDGRLHEYVLGIDAQRFAVHERFFVDDVRSWVSSRFGVALPADRTGVWGASLGAELALAMGLRHPDVYGAVFAASPGGGYRPPDALPEPLPRAYLVAGTQEPFFMDNATRWADAFRNAGAQVAIMQREGEHGGAFWTEELALMVAWAFGH
jgi:enterochelin esterase-like enzyme